jgi:predicted nucleic acid-binding protein
MGYSPVTVDEALDGIDLLYVETAPFIYFVEQHPDYIDSMRLIFRHVSSTAVQVITSTITLTEVLTMPIKLKQKHYLQEYREMLLNTEAISVRSVDASIAEQAAHMRAKYGLRTPDALRIATALSAQCQAFLTNNLGLKRTTEVNVIVLNELQPRSD